jgi:hypothetical protein
MLKLDSGLKADLLAQPESGMGYQIVEATDFNGRIQRGVAFNGIVEAALGQPGGGAEVLFRDGTDPGTVKTKPEKIPDE